MKSDKKQEPERDFEEVRDHQLPLELVAATALHFLGNPEESKHETKDAIDRAISFLETCAKAIRRHHRSRANEREFEDMLKEHRWEADQRVSFSEGIKFITGQSRLDRAELKYRGFIKRNVLQREPLTAAEIAKTMKKDREEGFAVQWLPLQKNLFDASKPKKKR